MSAPLPSLTLDEFDQHLRLLSPLPLDGEALLALFGIYEELRRWNPRLALIGPGTADSVLERHFGESLAALPLLSDLRGGALLDVGSGAGFPGLVLAAVRRDLDVTLVEARGRKWAYLEAVARRAALPCRCLNARVESPLPQALPLRLDVVTMRAVRLPESAVELLAKRLTGASRFLFWSGERAPALPSGFAVGRTVRLPGSQRRRIVEWRRVEGPGRT